MARTHALKRNTRARGGNRRRPRWLGRLAVLLCCHHSVAVSRDCVAPNDPRLAEITPTLQDGGVLSPFGNNLRFTSLLVDKCTVASSAPPGVRSRFWIDVAAALPGCLSAYPNEKAQHRPKWTRLIFPLQGLN